jgi:outer membrane protein OmpA-like peptidoglycan-associated protein
MKYMINPALKAITLFCICLLATTATAQKVEGYAYETGNRGYLNVVKVDLVDVNTSAILETVFSDIDGKIALDLPPSGSYELHATKDMFEELVVTLDRSAAANGKLFVKLEMRRAPGYIFEVTLAPKRASENQAVDGIRDARVEVYNNTTKQEVLVTEANPTPQFRLNLLKGNHYTILVRKEGYLAKRMEAFVNVKGCILCFEGVGQVQPGVSDNLSQGNEMGVLLANVEMDPSFEGKKLSIRNLYYDLDKATLREESAEELRNLINIMQDNPKIAVEIGSHTDSRGKTAYNQKLSEARAKSVVDYLINNGSIPAQRMIAKGYGESQLYNDCADGVKCSESQHQENRRTELTILGETEESRLRSLKEMKQEEEFMAMLLSGEGNEQIEVSSEEDLQQLIKEQEQRSQTTAPSQPPTTTQQEIVETPPTMPDATADPLPPGRSEESEGKTDGLPPMSNKRLDMPATDVSGEAAAIAAQQAKLEAKKQKEMNKGGRNFDLPIEPPAIPAVNTEPPAMPNIEEPQAKLEGVELARDATGELLTGFMVVIHESKTPLAEDDEIFARHNRVYSYLTAEGEFWYMLGRYPTKISAERESKSFLQATYPDCRIVNFVDGKVMTSDF